MVMAERCGDAVWTTSKFRDVASYYHVNAVICIANRILTSLLHRVLSRHLLGGKLPPPNFGTPPPRNFGQVYSTIKNPVIAVIQCAAVIQV